MKYAFISAEKANHSVQQMCEVLQVSRGGYYDWLNRKPSKRTMANRQLLDEIQMLYAQHKGRYGSPE